MADETRRPAVTERDREYFRRIGEWKRESHEAAGRDQVERSGVERLRYSFGFSLGNGRAARIPDDDDPTKFYERARQLGFYKP